MKFECRILLLSYIVSSIFGYIFGWYLSNVLNVILRDNATPSPDFHAKFNSVTSTPNPHRIVKYVTTSHPSSGQVDTSFFPLWLLYFRRRSMLWVGSGFDYLHCALFCIYRIWWILKIETSLAFEKCSKIVELNTKTARFVLPQKEYFFRLKVLTFCEIAVNKYPSLH